MQNSQNSTGRQARQQQQQPYQQGHSHHHHNSAENNKSPASIPPNSLAISKSYVPAPASSTSDDTDFHESDARYECAICIHWLNEPVITTCGHRFCKSCLTEWLNNHNQCCPLDNTKLSTEHDIFPDNFTRREIEQLKHKCPNSPLGCAVVASPIEVDRHLPTCPYRRLENAEEKCPFASVKCDFVGRPETNALEEHLKEDMPHHMQLMLQAFQQTAVSTWNPQKLPSAIGGKVNGVLPPPPPQYANEADEQLIQTMYQRIVVLEQRVREQDVKLENLTKQLATRQQIDPRYSNGTIVWEITNFRNVVEQLRADANNLLYSRDFYTSPHGYRFCARLNIQPRHVNLLSLHVHLMQSENDFHLDWPFKGRIKLCMIHPHDPSLSQHDTIMTKPEVMAFHKPRERISTRGFGFVEYAKIADVMHKGFCENDKVVIKIQINIV
ncbi:TNF receptor-associated factor 6 [Rhagoletis pomonella]|uniref:TNF receptor-associated factor 6 n=1 Tax=Rhagoletis pomonella TaxID=28610 RepID=UPI00177F01C2|nr:TNF receptor-associated factor 6 [Rhagoletis pomonella]